jgi:hypothetical protein
MRMGRLILAAVIAATVGIVASPAAATAAVPPCTSVAVASQMHGTAIGGSADWSGCPAKGWIDIFLQKQTGPFDWTSSETATNYLLLTKKGHIETATWVPCTAGYWRVMVIIYYTNQTLFGGYRYC